MKPSSACALAVFLYAAFGGLGVSFLRAQQSPTSASGSAQGPSSGAAAPGTQSRGLAPGATTMNYGTSRMFPNVLAPYVPPPVPAESMSNSQLLTSLIRDGKLYLSVDDAIALALENNLDIAVARYQIPFAQTDYLRALAGGATRGVTGAFQSSAQFAGAIGGGVSGFSGGGTGNAGGFTGGGGAINVGALGCCDPTGGFNFGWSHVSSPLNFTVISGIPEVTTQNTSYSGFFGQGFLTGTSYLISLNGFRQSTTSLNTLFNPEVPTGLTFGVNQHLLNGFGERANGVFIRQGRNDLKIADSTFRQQVITTVSKVVNDYYTLLYDQENVRVAQESVNYANHLLDDNKKQVQIGTLAPIEVVRADSESATDAQNLIVAQTTLKQQEEVLKTDVAKQVGTTLDVEIEATDKLPEPQPDDIAPLQQALTKAVQNRPELEQADLNLRNQDITIKSTRNRLLPTFDVFATYAPTGLSGNSSVLGCPAGSALVSTNGECLPAGGGTLLAPIVTGTKPGGVLQSLTQVLQNRYPYYSYGANLTIPIRNRSAQADAARALLEEHQLQAQRQRTKNQVEQDVRNAEIAVTQAKAQIDATIKAADLSRQTLDADRKKFQLGESTTFQLIQDQRDLTTAEGNQAKAHQAYAAAITQYGQATATILDKYNVQMADARKGEVTKVPNIPGTAAAPAASTEIQ